MRLADPPSDFMRTSRGTGCPGSSAAKTALLSIKSAPSAAPNRPDLRSIGLGIILALDHPGERRSRRCLTVTLRTDSFAVASSAPKPRDVWTDVRYC